MEYNSTTGATANLMVDLPLMDHQKKRTINVIAGKAG